MFVVGFNGCTVEESHWIFGAIERYSLGGIILFDRNVNGTTQNIRTPLELQQLTASLQAHARIPLFIAVDQEGGRIQRLKEDTGFSSYHSAAWLGQKDIKTTSDQAMALAEELRQNGINLNFAPVVDLNLNPANPIIGRYERSFGADPAEVVRYAQAFITAHHFKGIGCCLKHFPGHGSATEDSHLGFVDITACWEKIELQPFNRLISSGYCDGVMTAHVVNRHLDESGRPATLSRPIINDLLKGQLQFSGVTFSDDLQMRAIADRWQLKRAVQLAVLAGVDCLIIGNNLEQRQDAVQIGIDAIAELLDKGEVDESHILGSLNRIARFKQKIIGEIPWQSSERVTTL